MGNDTIFGCKYLYCVMCHDEICSCLTIIVQAWCYEYLIPTMFEGANSLLKVYNNINKSKINCFYKSDHFLLESIVRLSNKSLNASISRNLWQYYTCGHWLVTHFTVALGCNDFKDALLDSPILNPAAGVGDDWFLLPVARGILPAKGDLNAVLMRPGSGLLAVTLF